MTSRTIVSATSTILVFLALSAIAVEPGPQGVSPGATGRLAQINSVCPTFTWESAPGAQQYELVVYWIDSASMGSGSLQLTPDNEVLYASISGRAAAWTPESSDCFVPGERYVWFIRAVMDTETGERSEWSETRFFEVAAAPTADELGRAIEVLRRWEAVNKDGPVTLSSAPASASAAVADSGATATHLKSVITGTAAIRGEQPDPAGETYGVVGTSASPDGAGIGAANTAGGPDLVLDGAVPTEISEAGIDRPSGSPQTFGFSNTGGGGMTLDIDGIEVVTTATDRDTVGALSCGSGELAKWDGAIWTCAPDLDTDTLHGLPCGIGEIAKHDGADWVCAPDIDTDTLHDLSCGVGQVAKYDGVDWVCAEDEDTTYVFGPGLMVDGGQVVVDPNAFTSTVSTLDINFGISMPGRCSSIAIGADGLGLISYREEMGGNDLKVAHCNDIPCTGATISTVDATVGSGWYTSIAIGADGLGLISYYDSSALKVAHCNDIPCTSATVSTLDSAKGYTSITIGTDDLGLISYYDFTNHDLKVAHCSDTTCSSATVTTLDSTGDVGTFPSIAIGPLGLGVISYNDVTNGKIKIAQCGNVMCTSASLSVLDDGAGISTSIAIGADDLPLITYSDGSSLKVVHCNDVLCSSRTRRVVDNSGAGYLSMTIGADGFGLISYTVGSTLKVAHCHDASCTSATTRAVASVFVWENSIALGTDGRGLISFYDGSNYCLKAAHLPLGY